MSTLITALLALTTSIDPKVKFIHQKPQAGSNAWDQIVFNDYCYESLKGSTGGTETRTRAMLAMLGKAAELLAKEDPTGQLSMRTFYRNAKGENVPRLHISVRPGTTQQAPVMDAQAELAHWTEKAVDAGVDFSDVPKAISDVPAAYVGWLRARVTKLNTAAANAEVTGNVDTGESEEAPF